MCECQAAPAFPGHREPCVASPHASPVPQHCDLSAPAGQATPARNVGTTWPKPSEREAEGAQGLTAGTDLKTNERTEGELFLIIMNLETENKSLFFHRGPSAACNFISPICFYCLLWALSEPPDLQATALAVCQARLSKYRSVKPVPLPAALRIKLMSCSMRQSAGCFMTQIALRNTTLPPSSGESFSLHYTGSVVLQLGNGSRAGRAVCSLLSSVCWHCSAWHHEAQLC